jgi:hypothetical protein
LEKLKKIIDELQTMQSIDYQSNSYGWALLNDVISTLVMLHDAEACSSNPMTVHTVECGK